MAEGASQRKTGYRHCLIVTRSSLTGDDFDFQYKNLERAEGRHETWLCWHSYDDYFDDSFGIVSNDDHHAEANFISHMKTSPGKDYNITIYISWSPCSDCSEQLVQFLQQNSNIKLFIYTSRLYNIHDKKNQAGLRSLRDAGVEIEVMYRNEFEYCWEHFVNHQGLEFPGWDDLDKNCSLTRDDFVDQYDNLRLAKGRHETWLCWHINDGHDKDGHDKDGQDKDPFGIFSNDYLHAEEHFISRMKTLPREDHKITIYISWSPCSACSEQLVQFLQQNSNIKLFIYTSRLYYIDNEENQAGLRSLRDAGVEIEVMHRKAFLFLLFVLATSPFFIILLHVMFTVLMPKFEYCWEHFVTHQGLEFPGWDDLDENSLETAELLQEILEGTNQ
ncbi:DNA dC-_dU-editing enzyme APOBEC-3F-like [Entelurus aequoreus]|uniref:DNA dC->dU-editing enzyme APOBEC-3F-like n=1 Tax=Entelurus aequoreus TaxID=161455 RepID=UPI002B1DE382|nr:DNA dC->dU-editing enzyme APOBEC-3F-like [Entelurus aequoreus]